MKSLFAPGVILFSAALVLSASCGSRDLKIPVSATYSSIQQVTIAPKCVQCHSSLSSYAGFAAVVKAGFPDDSRLYKAVAGGSMPQHSAPLSDAEVQAIRSWIQAGALNN